MEFEVKVHLNVDIMTIPIRNPIKLNQDQISNQNVESIWQMHFLSHDFTFVCICYTLVTHALSLSISPISIFF